MPPVVSVIVPVHDGERFLPESLPAITNQTHEPVELIVVDDGSSDDSARVAAELVAAHGLGFVHRQSQRGIAAARNVGLMLATGELVAFCDQDDVWLPEKLSRQLAYLDANPGLGVVMTRQEPFFDSVDAPPRWLRPDHVYGDLGGVLPCTMLVRRQAFDRVGGFDTSRSGADDMDWLFRARRAGVGIATVPEILVRRRIHPGNTSNDARAIEKGLMRALYDLTRDHRTRG